MSNRDRRRNATRLLSHIYSALNDYHLECFGDDLAYDNSYPLNVGGMDAIHFYLMKKYGWNIAHCQALTTDQISLALTEEMSGWKAHESARFDLQIPNIEQLLEK